MGSTPTSGSIPGGEFVCSLFGVFFAFLCLFFYSGRYVVQPLVELGYSLFSLFLLFLFLFFSISPSVGRGLSRQVSMLNISSSTVILFMIEPSS